MTRAVLVTAIARARRDGFLRALGPLAETAGYRRVLASRIAAWTRAGRDPKGEPPPGAGADDWEVFRRYRKLLKSKSLDSEDSEGFANWAAGALKSGLETLIGPSGSVVIHDPTTPGGCAVRRALRAFQDRAGSLLVTLPWEEDEARREVFADVAPLRSRLRDWGFVETIHIPDVDRPPGLLSLGRDLFRVEPADRRPDPDGLQIRGAPRGEGLALIVAREVRDRLAAGADPEDVLILFPRWGEQADLTLDALRSWGLPATGGPGRSLAAEPSVAAWLTALSIPVEHWESAMLVRLLRHGQFQPDWPEVRPPFALAGAAAAIRDTRIFRDRDTIRQALKGAANVDPDEKDRRIRRKAERARLALPIFDRLADVLEGLDLPASWRRQAAKARSLASALGLDAGLGAEALARLFAALDDHAAILDALGQGKEVVYWSDFVREAAAIVRELDAEPDPIAPGSVRLANVAEAEGAVARHVLLAGLEEGTFPDREAIDLDPATPADEDADGLRPADAAFARELRRFLGVASMARESLTFLYPTADEKGQGLLAAGFLDDVERLFTPEALASCRTKTSRLDPILPADLALAPAEHRVRAVGRACLEPGAESQAELAALAACPEHRGPLAGAAAALRLQHRRSRRTRFGPYEGGLIDPAAIRKISADYSNTRPLFSASQLETLASCPFKYFLRHVLKLEPIDDRNEFDEDFTRRGLLVHEALETLHQMLKAEIDDTTPLPDRVKDRIIGVINTLLDRELDPASDVDRGLLVIDAERLRRTGLRYARQFATYHDGAVAIECHDFEVRFGQEDALYPGLVLGDGGDGPGLQLQGMIDRIDLLRIDGRVFFRIIDYKTGHCPGKRQVEDGLALQLPLYALAAQKHILEDLHAEPLDAAYWGLRDGKGFTPAIQVAKLDRKKGTLKPATDWEGYLQRLEAFVIALVDRLRHADFPVHPREPDCTRSCDYRNVCRIGQVRHARKSWPEAPVMPKEEPG